MSFVDEAKAAIAAFKAKRIAKQAKKLAKKKVIYGGQLMALGDTPQNTYISLHTSAPGKHAAKMNALQAKMDEMYTTMAAKEKEMAAKQLEVLSQQVQPMISSWVTSSVPYNFSSGVVSISLGGEYNQSHGYYDAGVNNKKMVSDLEAKVAELKAELDKKKLQEEALATTDGKRVVEI